MLGLAVLACSNNNRVPLKQLPVQLGRAPPPTPTPFPTATPIPPPPCENPVAEITNVSQEAGPSADTHVVTGHVKSRCSVAVDLTLNVKWLDGPERTNGPRAFATLRRVLPGEVRPFSEVVAGGRGATRLDLSATALTAIVGRRR